MAKLFSFDVFDTCLTRVYARPGDLFLGLGRHLRETGLWTNSSLEFKRLRMEAENQARRAAAPREITLSEIYECLATTCSLTPEALATMQREEIAWELRALKPVPEIQSRIRKLHAAGERVVFISEMYLPPEIIRQALDAAGIWKAGDGLYVSNESGLHKRRGLFALVLERECLAPVDLSHIGDSQGADVEAPRLLGVTADCFEDTMLNRHEVLLRDQCAMERQEAAALVAGASRLARLDGWDMGTARPFWDIGASVIGPLFASFVAWTLKEAVARGLDRLYFIARDGQIFLRLASLLPESQVIECRYLHGSRQAWHLPGITGLNEEDLQWILLPTPNLTFERLLRRLELTYDEVASVDRNLPLPLRDDLVELESYESLKNLLFSPRIKELIEKKASNARKLTLGYFKDEGLFEPDVRWGIVDIGWGGNLQRSLKKILAAVNGCPPSGITGFYYRLKGAPFLTPDQGVSFLDKIVPSDDLVAATLRYVFMLELFARADHGGVRGYRWNGCRHEPVQNTDDLSNGVLHGVREQQAGAESFLKHLLSVGGIEDLDPLSAIKVFIDFCERPSATEALAYGALPFQSDQTGRIGAQWAPQVGVTDAFRYSLFGFEGKWMEGLIARNTGLSRIIFQLRTSLRRLREKRSKSFIHI